MRNTILGGLVVLFVAGFLVYAKTRLPEAASPRETQRTDTRAENARSTPDLPERESKPARGVLPADVTSTADLEDDTPVPDDEIPRRRTAAPSQDDDTGTGDPRRYTEEDDRGSSAQQLRQASFLREWVDKQRALTKDVEAIGNRVREGDAAAAQTFNEAFEELVRELVDEFGSRLAAQYVKRIPIYHMDVETGVLIRVDETGTPVEEPASRRGG